ncbi:tegument protein pp150 [Mandrillus leucophaeus cytomegalovirus]|uniref:Tegument protein pp150 n=1 Tax=Mandrillus leucophaeus cytomegalovirus TaxID=1654930 RepID=A0A0G2UI62_9BETA|nr:tegument protein pp150 [Mandrillus leucophaeus cytomegalovirus]AKI29789.1 tegument protein pp150 [Mandrillus leucophaeus cytomegalovirus]
MSLKFIGLSPRHTASINKFLQTLSKRPNVDLEQNAKILRRCGERTLHRRSVMFNKLVLWLGYYRELRYHTPDLSSLLNEFEVQASEVTRRAHVYPFRKPVIARPHLRTMEATGFKDNARTDVQVVQGALESATALAKLSECQPLTVGEVAFIQLREKDVMMLEDSLRNICSNMFEIQPAQLTIERHYNSSLVNATNKLVYLGRVIIMIRTCWDALTEKCILVIKDLCKSLMKELKTCKSFESNYCSNIIKHGVRDGESADMLLEMLMEDFAIYEDIFPRSSTSGSEIGSMEYDDEELRTEWQKWLKGARRDGSPEYNKWDTKKDKWDTKKDEWDTKKDESEKKHSDTKTDRQMAFSMLSPTDTKADFWEKPTSATVSWEKPALTTTAWKKSAATTVPSAKRVTFWPDDDKEWENTETDNVKVDKLVDLGNGLEGLKLDSKQHTIPVYKFEPPKLAPSTEHNPFIQPIPHLEPTSSFQPIKIDNRGLFDWSNELSSLKPTDAPTIVPVFPPDSDVETKGAASDLSDVDFTDPNSNFSPAKRRDPSETEASDDDDDGVRSEVADLFSDDGSDAESVASVASVAVTPKAKRKLVLEPPKTVKLQPKPKPSLGPFPPVDPLAAIDTRRILKPTVKPVTPKPPVATKPVVLKPATLQVPATTTASSAKTALNTVSKALGSTPPQSAAKSVTEKVVKPQTVSSTQVLKPAAEKLQAKALTSPATSPFKSTDGSGAKPIPLPSSSPSKDSETGTDSSQSAIQAIIDKIKEDARENEE